MLWMNVCIVDGLRKILVGRKKSRHKEGLVAALNQIQLCSFETVKDSTPSYSSRIFPMTVAPRRDEWDFDDKIITSV